MAVKLHTPSKPPGVRALLLRFGSLSAVVLATVPAHHIYGLLFRVLWPLASKRAFASSLIRYPQDLIAALEPGSVAYS